MKKSQYYMILAILLFSVGIVELLCIHLHVIDSKYSLMPTIPLLLSLTCAGLAGEIEKKNQWDNADEIQRAELMRKKLERESKSKKIRDTMVKVGIAIIVVLGILAIVL